MHVDVDVARRQLEEQRHDGMAVAGEQILIGGPDGAAEQLVADRTPVHEQELHPGVAPIERGQARVAGQRDTVALGPDGDRVLHEVPANDLPQSVEAGGEQILLAGRRANNLAGAVADRERDPGMGQRQALDGIHGVAELRPFRLEKLEPRGRRVEQVPHLDPGPRRMRGRRHVTDRAALDAQRPGRRRVTRAARQRQATDRSDGG